MPTNNVIQISARPFEEDSPIAYYRRDGKPVYRRPGWIAVSAWMAVTIGSLWWLIVTVMP